jgi:thiamine biosynthesis lipoprotein
MILFLSHRILFFTLLVLPLLLMSCDRQHTLKFAGETQGTTYHVTIVEKNSTLSRQKLQQRIEQRLGEIDAALSNYRDDSELNRFNRAAVGEWVELNRDLYTVLTISDRISRASDGAFDVTVAPLVELWGFGPNSKSKTVPAEAAVKVALAQVGYRYLDIDPAQPRAKKLRTLSVDVNGIAQGYTVDQLAEVLSAEGCVDFMVEVGGELRLAGHNVDAELWAIDIEQPSDGLVQSQQVIAATAVGITTAGDYHDYFEKDGRRYSHTIDPRTGKPIAHALASVTVIASSAVVADGYDTALEVMGPEAGFAFAQRMNIAAYFIERDAKGFVARATPAMHRYLGVGR